MLSKLRLEYFEEGLCAQVMHIGPYATEPATVEPMREFMNENRYRNCVGLDSKHHEIYLGDPFICTLSLHHMAYADPPNKQPTEMIYRINDVASNIDLILWFYKTDY